MKIKRNSAAYIFIIVGVFFISVLGTSFLSFFQKMKYGDPRIICIDNVQIKAKSDWMISLVYKGKGTYPKLYGVLPIPKNLSNLDVDKPQVTLRHKTALGTFSMHLNETRLSKEELKAECLVNSFCSIKKSKLNDGAEVMEVIAGSTVWITYLDRKVMLGIDNSLLDQLKGLEISSCTNKG